MALFVLLGYGKTVSHVVIGLKTVKGTKQLKLDPSIYESLQKEKVEVGDVIYIEANSGAVKVRLTSPPPPCSSVQHCDAACSRRFRAFVLLCFGWRDVVAVVASFRGKVARTHSPLSTTSRPRSTYRCPKATSTKRKRSFRT